LNKILVEVEVAVHPTEDPKKVERAVRNIISNPSIETAEESGGTLVVKAKAEGKEALMNFYNLLRFERIRNAARAVLSSCASNNTIIFYLNKQVAYVNRLSFSQPSAESPLGPIRIKINCEDPAALIDWLTSTE
jgi:predicted RNA binding protein with dsRBD fold (UPF0201 family)